MLAVKITDTRGFMKHLLAGDLFDPFLFSEGTVTTFTTFSIDGTWHPDYYTAQDDGTDAAVTASDPTIPAALTWKLVRPILFDIIKGRHTPISFRIVLRLADYNVEKLLASGAPSIEASQVAGLFLNLNYQGSTVTCTTGTSLRVFTMDKTLDRVWDEMVLRFFRSRQIPYEEL